MKIQRTGKRPLEFEGTQLASASSRNHAGRERNRWHEITVYQTAGNKYVVSIEYRTQWEGESPYDDAVVFDTIEEIGILLEEYIFPNIAQIGFPPGTQYVDRQAHLQSSLMESFAVISSKILDGIGASEKL